MIRMQRRDSVVVEQRKISQSCLLFKYLEISG